jgi:hypothetical protein
MGSGSVSKGIAKYNRDVKKGRRSAHAYVPPKKPKPVYTDTIPF